MTRRVIRRLTAGVCHVADIDDTTLVLAKHLGSPFYGVPLPWVTACGAELRGDVAVCMQDTTKVSCARCRRITGIDRAPDGNHLVNGHPARDAWEVATR